MPDDRAGHRGRLRQRFRQTGRKGLADYELLELLLSFAIARRDVKPLAKDLIRRFGSLPAVLDAGYAELEETDGLGPQAATLLKLTRALANRYLEPSGQELRVFDSPTRVLEHVRAELGGEAKEAFMLLCLNAAGQLVHQEIISNGTVNETAVYPREVMATALKHNAGALILVHNHPSGNLKPSPQDRSLTDRLTAIGQSLGISVHDHLIVSREGAYSLRLDQLVA